MCVAPDRFTGSNSGAHCPQDHDIWRNIAYLLIFLSTHAKPCHRSVFSRNVLSVCQTITYLLILSYLCHSLHHPNQPHMSGPELSRRLSAKEKGKAATATARSLAMPGEWTGREYPGQEAWRVEREGPSQQSSASRGLIDYDPSNNLSQSLGGGDMSSIHYPPPNSPSLADFASFAADCDVDAFLASMTSTTRPSPPAAAMYSQPRSNADLSRFPASRGGWASPPPFPSTYNHHSEQPRREIDLSDPPYTHSARTLPPDFAPGSRTHHLAPSAYPTLPPGVPAAPSSTGSSSSRPSTHVSSRHTSVDVASLSDVQMMNLRDSMGGSRFQVCYFPSSSNLN